MKNIVWPTVKRRPGRPRTKGINNPTKTMHTTDDIDFNAALPLDTDQTTKTPPNTPPSTVRNGATTKPTHKKPNPPKSIDNQVNDTPSSIISNTLHVFNVDVNHTKDVSPHLRHDPKKLSDKELLFLDIYMSGNQTIEQAMTSAGFGHLHPNYVYQLAKKIIRKYEQGVSDAKNVFIEIGFGQISVAKGIEALAKNGRSEVVKLRALELAAKCLQMTKEVEQLDKGVQIVINCAKDDGPANQGAIDIACERLADSEPE